MKMLWTMASITTAIVLGALLGPVVQLSQFGREFGYLENRVTALEWQQAQPGAPEAEEKLIAAGVKLPADDQKWYAILFVDADWESREAQSKAMEMWQNDPWFVSLRAQTNARVILANSPEFAKNWRTLITVRPSLVIERANGEVMYREEGAQLGKRPRQLERAIKKEISRRCPNGHCLPLHPVPGPDKQAPAEEIPAVVQINPPEEERKAAFPVAAFGLAGLAGAAVYAKKFRHAM